MPRIQITETTVYKFAELDGSAKDRAIEWYSQCQSENFDPSDYLYEDFANIGDILGIDIRTRAARLMNGGIRYEPCVYYSGFSSQGDGACYEGRYRYAKGAPKAIRAYAPLDTELHRIADELQKLQRPWFYSLTATTEHHGRYHHSGCMRVEVSSDMEGFRDMGEADEALAELLRDFADWMYRSLESEYDYQTGREQCIEGIEANDYDFDSDGRRA